VRFCSGLGLKVGKLVDVAPPLTETGVRAVDGQHADRLTRLIREQLGFVWRLLRGVGVAEAEAPAAVQSVFEAAAFRIGDIRSANERSFLLSVTLHVVQRARRSQATEAAPSDRAPALEDLDESRQAREILGALLVQMPLELRVVFVLREIERMTNPEIAEVVGIPVATVASRLSEAEADFATHLDAESELSLSLLAAAREEQPPAEVLSRTLVAVGLRAPAVVSPAEAGAISAPGLSSVSGKARASGRSKLAIAATWLVIGWLVGGVAAALVYALTDAAAGTPRNAAAR